MTENICTRPFAVDWDGDGHLDLVVGNFAGTFYFFKGQGQGKFLPEPEQIKAGGQPLKVDGYHSDPFVIDWDGDGDLDLLSGSNEGGVQWAENRAGPGQTAATQAVPDADRAWPAPRVRPDPARGGPQGAARATRASGSTTSIPTASSTSSSAIWRPWSHRPTVTEAEFQTKFAAWKKSLAAAAKNELTRAATREAGKGELALRSIYQQRREFMKEDGTGFVWLYLRK